METKEEFGSIIRIRRKLSGLSLRELARKVEISPTYLSKVERGDFDPPSSKVIVRLCLLLDIDRDRMLAMCGKVAPDVLEMYMTNPMLYSNLIRNEYNGYNAILKRCRV